MRKIIIGAVLTMLLLEGFPHQAKALENEFAGNYLVPKHQSGYYEENYEGKVAQKFLRGAQNFALASLEVPHGVKSEFYYRKQEYLPAGVETVFVGAFKGLLNGLGRACVGLYEMFSASYPQEPILPEMKDWLY